MHLTFLYYEALTALLYGLAIVDGAETKVGAPVVENATVDAKVVKNGKGKKIRIFKYTPKKGYRKRQGHRQPYTKVEIAKINF